MDSSVSPITKTLIVLMSLSSWIYQLLITNFILSVKKSTENGYEPTFSPDIDRYLHKRNHSLLLNTSKTGRARTLVLRNKLKHLDGKQQAKQHKMHPLVSNPIFLFSLRLLMPRCASLCTFLFSRIRTKHVSSSGSRYILWRSKKGRFHLFKYFCGGGWLWIGARILSSCSYAPNIRRV